MTLEERIVLFSTLGKLLLDEKNKAEIYDWAGKAKMENAWFTEDNVLLGIQNIAKKFLSHDSLVAFSAKIKETTSSKRVGIVAAGNIPLACFHDFLCVLLSGHRAMLKPSSSDSVLIRHLIAKLKEIEPGIGSFIELSERLNEADAYIATGSDNSSRYFEYYFGKKPHIIRKNRSSLAILTGNENSFDLRNLGNDIFQYFGLGCRNVSKLLVPENYYIDTFFEAIEYWNSIMIHHKYHNNYDYNKSIYLINGDKHLDNGFLLLKEDSGLVSPLTVLFYERYANAAELEQKLAAARQKIQTIVGEGHTTFGTSQSPNLDEFADGVDTIDFLNKLK